MSKWLSTSDRTEHANTGIAGVSPAERAAARSGSLETLNADGNPLPDSRLVALVAGETPALPVSACSVLTSKASD